MTKLLYFIEKHQLAILATLLIHFVILLAFNWVEVTTLVMKDPVIRIDFSEQKDHPWPEPDLPKETDDLPVTNGESVGNTAKNESARMLNSKEYNKLNNETTKQSKQSVDDEIRSRLKALEQGVLNEQREAGYGYTPEQAEKYIQSFEAEDVKDIPKQDARSEGAFKGETNISYRLENRYDTYIYVPVYLCQYGGSVTVAIIVDKSGNVVKSKLDNSSATSKDVCLREAALKAANRMKFNESPSAPAIQKGSVTFVFQAQ